MSNRTCRVLLVLFVGTAGTARGTAAELTAIGQRVAMGFAPGQEPTHKPGSLNFVTGRYHAQPVIYRTVWRFGEKPAAAPVRIQANDWVFVWINGRCVIEHARRGKKGPLVEFPLEADLAPHLAAGANVVAVSATKEGFALAGWADVDGGIVTLTSRPELWRVWKFAPLTILEKEPFLREVKREGVAHAACRDGEAPGVRCTAAEGARIVESDLRRRLAAQLADIAYESRLLNVRGVAIVDDRAIGHGGAGAVHPAALAAAGKVHRQCPQARALLDKGGASLREARAAVEALQARLDAAKQLVSQGNRLTGCRLVWAHLKPDSPLPASWGKQLGEAAELLSADRGREAGGKLAELARLLGETRAALRRLWGAPLNELDSAVANKAGWIDDPTLLDSDPEAWGVRFNPMGVSWFLDLAGKWRFKLDPRSTGLAERVHEFGYNIANQWPELNVPGYWEKQGAKFQIDNPDAVKQSPFPGVNERTDGPYNGFAWYRKKVLVPKEWAGYDLELYMGAVDDWDWAYWNGEQVGHTGAKSNPKDWWYAKRRYRVPKEKVTFGGYNVICVRVYDCGAGGGILGGIELRCPALKASFEQRPARPRKPTTVFASPLSPAALLTVGEKELEIYGWDLRSSAGPDGIVMKLGKSVYRRFPPPPETGERAHVVYDAKVDGPLRVNWVLLWAKPGRADGELPTQLVFLQRPLAITVRRGQTGTSRITVRFGQEGAQLFALRPIRGDSGAAEPIAASSACGVWSRAVLAYPVHYAELVRLSAGRKDRLDVVDLYDYRVLRDAWGTKPLRLAALPPLACYGLSVGARDLTTDAGPLEPSLSLGDYGQFRAAIDTNAVRYTVPVDTLPRLGGFTSYCFGPDVGVPGNHKEIEIMAYTGCNSWRPQSNDRGRRILDTVRWANAAGMNLMFNIDNGLGAKPEAVDHWVTLGKAVANLPPWAAAHDLINEPANMPPGPYNRQIRRIVRALRKVDPAHMIYVETPHSFASIDQFITLTPVDDEAVVYTFHDYDYRLPPRWPTLTTDIRNIQHQWLPAFRYSLKHDAPICISEYGGFEQTPNDPWTNRSTLVLLADFFKVFDQFGMHHHYYSNRGVARVRADGSIGLSLVHEAIRRLFAGGTFYRFRDNWHAGVTMRQRSPGARG